MINILLNETNFDRDWAAEALACIIRPEMRVLMMPLSDNHGWASDALAWQDGFESDGDYHYDLTRPFRSYGLMENHISWLNYYDDDFDGITEKIQKSDILFLVGDDPDACMNTLEDLALINTLRCYHGIVMGADAGAKIQFDEYYPSLDDEMRFEYHKGLGLLSGFDIETQYEEDPFHIAGIIRAIESKDHPVIVMPRKGGVMISEGNMNLLGDSFTADRNDLDDLYRIAQGF
ncbi:MAG: hypothetical protein EOM64_07405 [Erysipelotrichia bacterium]|nr:hypothetical protein [Erysipelotrichia bacterium]